MAATKTPSSPKSTDTIPTLPPELRQLILFEIFDPLTDIKPGFSFLLRCKGLSLVLIDLRISYMRHVWRLRCGDVQLLAQKLSIVFPGIEDDIDYVRGKTREALLAWREGFEERVMEMGRETDVDRGWSVDSPPDEWVVVKSQAG
ncbi:hypothetical protein E2P81_ATG04491 [Venturia nashicola]|nr:hypothetical protein E2P81_ATG04491 [Venturia nashicola]